MTDEIQQFYYPRRQVVLAVLVFAILALMLNTGTFVDWAYDAPFPAVITEWLIAQADRIDSLGQQLGLNTLYDSVQGAVSALRE